VRDINQLAPEIRAEASGRFVLRLEPRLHAALREAAKAAGLSLNDWCVRRLAAPGCDPGALPDAGRVVLKAARILGDGLVGVALFGSWVRGEATAGSDIDVLLVAEASFPLTRSLYGAWDESPLEWGGRPVEPHFVHLPAEGERSGGLWAEVALDGVVLFERGLLLSRHLGALRRAIASGRLERRLAQGQPYWVEAKAS
jgi:predicted nucleotidyltransferase